MDSAILNQSDPTTGEIVRVLRGCAEKTFNCEECPYNTGSNIQCLDNIQREAADRLESQEQTIAALTARAEQAEANMPWVRIDGWDYFCQVKMFDPKANQITVNDKKYGWHTVGYEKVKEWRGLPQDGEGK